MSQKKKTYTKSHTPVLNRHLLEGAFAECLSQVLMSLDQCRMHKVTKELSIEQHIRALWGITLDEMGTALMLTEGRHNDTLVRKHRHWVQRTQTARTTLLKLNPNDEADLSAILGGITMWIQDAHLILHEDTPAETRAYLSRKGLSDVEDEARSIGGVQ